MRATLASPGTASHLRTGVAPDATLLRRIAAVTVLVGSLDASFGLVAYVVIASRYNLETLLQYIATGLLGDSAYRTGAAGVGTAAVGLAVHFSLAAGFTAAFALTIGRLARTRTHVIIAGLVYGAAVWILMANAVLPALHVVHEPIGGRYWWAFLIGHALLIGLPIALLTSKATAPTRR